MYLLCPVHLPAHMVVILPLFMLCSCVLPLLGMYRFYWYLLYARGPLLGRGVRVQGQVSSLCGEAVEGWPVVFGRAPGGVLMDGPFVVVQGNSRVSVDPCGALLKGWPRRIRLGDRVTVDGVDQAVPLPGERLYRDPVLSPGIAAIQIIKGTLPRLHKLTWVLALTWLVCLGLLLSTLLFI
jgi:hypothetical protein